MNIIVGRHTFLKLCILVMVSLLFTDSKAQNIPDSVIKKADEYYFAGKRQELLGNADAAYELLTHSYELNPYSPPTLFELAIYYTGLSDDSTALRMIKKAVEYAPDNYWYKDALVRLYASHNNVDSAIVVLEQLSVQYPGKTEVLSMLESMYLSKKDYANVIKTLDKIELKEGKSEYLSMEKFRTYYYLNDEEHAFAELRSLADEYPNDIRFRILIGDLYSEKGKYDEAYKAYMSIYKTDSTDMNLLNSLARYYSNTHQDSLANVMLNRAVINPSMSQSQRVAFMNSVVYNNIQDNGDTTQIMQLFRGILRNPQPDGQIPELCVRYMMVRDFAPKDVKPVLNQLLAIDPKNDIAISTLLRFAIESQDENETKRVCQSAISLSIDQPSYYYCLGVIYFREKEYGKAIEVLNSGLSHMKLYKNCSLDEFINTYVLIGDSYYRQDNWRKSFAAYDTCLIYRPQDPMILNNYAYYLSVLNKDLSRAGRMSAIAISKDSLNSTYIDTYAWILFRQKKYNEAKTYIDKAMFLSVTDTLQEVDSTILEHAGDIYVKCGLKDEAVTLWQKALLLDPPNRALIETKIKKKKYIE